MRRVPTMAGSAFQDGSVRAGIVLAVLLLVWSQFQLGGLTVRLVNSWLVLALPLVVAAIGVTLVIISRQFDLSAAGVVTLVNVLVGTKLSGLNPALSVAIVIALGLAIGCVNGLLVVYGKLPAIAVTLAMLIVLNGLSLVLLPQPGGKVPTALVRLVTAPSIVPRAFIVLGLLVLLWLAFKRTRLGIYMFAVGQDEEALHLSGVSVPAVRMSIFAIAGGLYALAGVLVSAAIQTSDAAVGATYLLQTFAAIAIGGTAFSGGSGSAIGTMLGGLTLVVITKVLFVLGISDWAQDIFTGLLIIAAVLVGAVTNRRQIRKTMLAVPDSVAVAELPVLQKEGRS